MAAIQKKGGGIRAIGFMPIAPRLKTETAREGITASLGSNAFMPVGAIVVFVTIFFDEARLFCRSSSNCLPHFIFFNDLYFGKRLALLMAKAS